MTQNPGKGHLNNFGALRLLLAYGVIVSHSPEMLDGNPLREPLMAFGLNVTFGGLAVDGFFIISGYLITSSYLSSRSLGTFMSSRVLRIYPAFLLAFLICIFFVGPTAGGSFNPIGGWGWLSMFGKMISLAPPELPGAFHTLPIPALNGSMWTIRYEFRCYLLTALLGALGFLDRRSFVLSFTIMLYTASTIIFYVGGPVIPRGHLHQLIFGLVGDPQLIGLTAIFMSGVCMRLYRDKIQFHAATLLLSFLIICAAAVMASTVSEIAIGTAGAYLLLWASIGFKSQFLQKINNSYDFSYGVYLYAWPIASLVLLVAQQFQLGLTPAVLACVTALVATGVAGVSWYMVEQPMLALKWRLKWG
jgi:peptidoglycan/LPS O-acetylase OafA/YrhL